MTPLPRMNRTGRVAVKRALKFLPRVASRGALGVLKSEAVLRLIGTIKSFDTHDPVVALTFDDGPHPQFTPLLLDVLEKYTAKATFFMIGKNAQKHPGLVQKVVEAGHVVANHSWDHPLFTTITGRERRRQMRRCARAIAPYGRKIFRPPGGHQTLASRLDAFFLGYDVVTWNVMVGDWIDSDYDAISMFNALSNQIQPGSIVLLHDAIWNPETDRVADRRALIRAVEMLLEECAGDYRFVTLSALAGLGRPIRKLSRWGS